MEEEEEEVAGGAEWRRRKRWQGQRSGGGGRKEGGLSDVSLITLVPPPPLSTPSGTRVSDMASDKELYKGQDVSVKGFATIDNVVLINVEVCRGEGGGEKGRSGGGSRAPA